MEKFVAMVEEKIHTDYVFEAKKYIIHGENRDSMYLIRIAYKCD